MLKLTSCLSMPIVCLYRKKPGVPSDRTPGIIVNFFARPHKYRVVKEAKSRLNNAGQGIYIVEDLTPEDHYRKRCARDQMKAAHANKQKVSYYRGKLYIDSKVTEIKGLNKQ